MLQKETQSVVISIFQLGNSMEHVTTTTTVLETQYEAGSKQYKDSAGKK